MTISILDFPYNIKYQNKIPLILFLIFMVSGCNPKSDGEDFEPKESSKIDKSELCYFKFYEIDNQVKIYIDGEEVHDTGPIEWNQPSERTITLSDELSEGHHEIKLEVYNGIGLDTDILDEQWEVQYELFVNGVPVDFINEKQGNSPPGLAYSRTIDIEI
ncbi:MAG: hypothetical protein RIC35_24555 [Marinoscillum sp.]